MEKQRNKPTLTVDVSGLKLKIIRVGKSPRLAKRDEQAPMPQIHSHFTYEIFFVTEGKLDIVTETRRMTCERKVVIIPPHIGHYTIPRGEGSFCLLFSPEKGNGGNGALEKLKRGLGEKIQELPLSPDIEYYIGALSRKSDQNTSAAETDAKLLATLIFHELMALLVPSEEGERTVRSESKHMGAIETYINANFHKKLMLSDVAEQVYLSTRQVSRILQKEYGCTLSQLVVRKKLAAAQMLLRDTDMRIAEIASRVNLGAENYFYALFRKHFGTSPLQYRKQYQKVQTHASTTVLSQE